VDELTGTGYDTSFMMLNVTESIGVRKVYLVISKRKFHISFMVQLIVVSNIASPVEIQLARTLMQQLVWYCSKSLNSTVNILEEFLTNF
jgi:hypothetical protein